MSEEKTNLHRRIESGKGIVVVEVTPPKGSDPEAVREVASRYAGKVHAVGVSDNREGACMSAVAAAALIGWEGVEPILHMVTRDRNRIALVSDYLGARALGIRNVLCTTGTHQALGPSRSARNVFDVDSVQLLQALAGLGANGSVVGESGLNGAGGSCLGAAAAPYADPIELQFVKLAKKAAAGAKFAITQPVFDVDRFEAWWQEITRRGIHEKIAILAGIQPLTDVENARALAARRPCPMIPDAVLERLSSKEDKVGQRAEGIDIACATIERLSGMKGLRGFEIRADADDAALEIIEKSGLGMD